MAHAVSEINSCLGEEDSTGLLEALLNEHAGLSHVQAHNALHYITILRAMKKSKGEVKYNVYFLWVQGYGWPSL